MRPLRTFIDSVRLESVIDLPPGLRGRQLEVIVLPGSPPESEPDNMDDDVYLENENKKNEPWNTPKYRAEASKRRQAIEARLSKKKRMSKDEFLELLSRCPVADEEEIEMQDDFKMEMKRWNP